MKPLTELVIRDRSTHDGGVEALTAKITAEGDLVLEGYDSGSTVKKLFGDSDYEFWITIPQQYKDTVLLHLLKACFEQRQDVKAWLEDRGVPCKFFSYA